MMNHYIALTSLKGNKSKNGVLGCICLENVQKGICIVEWVLQHIKEMF